jgi:hypothetical protein
MIKTSELSNRILKKRGFFRNYKATLGRLKSVSTSIDRYSVIDSLIDNEIVAIRQCRARDADFKIKILLRAKKKIKYLEDVLIQLALEEQKLFVSRNESSIAYYRYQCRFKIDIENISLIKGFEKLEKYGIYNKDLNPNGVVKDHRVSVKFGFDNNICPSIIGNITNCEFLEYRDNCRKSDNCSVSLKELLREINRPLTSLTKSETTV